LDTRRSTSGFIFQVYGGTVLWQSKMQPTVASSTTEAEYLACSAATREALWLRQVLPHFGVPCTPLVIKGDSSGAIGAIKNHTVTARTKHIDVIHHFVRERYALGHIDLKQVGTKDNVADVLTKPLNGTDHGRCCEGMGIISVEGLSSN
jgi:hypothetical protein